MEKTESDVGVDGFYFVINDIDFLSGSSYISVEVDNDMYPYIEIENSIFGSDFKVFVKHKDGEYYLDNVAINMTKIYRGTGYRLELIGKGIRTGITLFGELKITLHGKFK